MKAMVLCAGLGTRLRPLTERWPKPALPFLGAPLLRSHLALLKAAGVQAVGINTHHLPDVMAAVAREECARAGLALHVVHEPVIQGTGGGIRGLRDFLEGDDFLVLNGDILFPLPLAPLLEAHRRSGAAATLVLLPMPERERYTAVELDAQRRVRRITGRGPGGDALTPWHFTGVHVMSPRVFDFMAPEGPEDINRDVYIRLLEAGLTLHGEVVRGYWSDLGTPGRYLATVRDVLEGRVPLEPLGPAGSPLGAARQQSPGVWAHPDAQPGAARLEGPAFLADGCRLGEAARIGHAVVVGTRAQVGAGAQLERTVVFDDTQVGEGEALTDTLAWGAHRIPAST